jgi:hypothetical protein
MLFDTHSVHVMQLTCVKSVIGVQSAAKTHGATHTVTPLSAVAVLPLPWTWAALAAPVKHAATTSIAACISAVALLGVRAGRTKDAHRRRAAPAAATRSVPTAFVFLVLAVTRLTHCVASSCAVAVALSASARRTAPLICVEDANELISLLDVHGAYAKPAVVESCVGNARHIVCCVWRAAITLATLVAHSIAAQTAARSRLVEIQRAVGTTAHAGLDCLPASVATR